MPSMNNWRTDSRLTTVTPADRAVSVWNRIQDNPSSIAIMRGSSNLSAQTVRVSYGRAQEVEGGAGKAGVRSVTIFGIRDHPDAATPDTDIQKGDRFVLSGSEYRVVDVAVYPGEVQAVAERVT